MKNLLDIFFKFEDALIERSLKTNYDLDNHQIKLTDELIHSINSSLLLTTETNLAFKSHKFLIDCLISYYLENKFINHRQLSEVFNLVDTDIDFISDKILNIESIPELIEELHITFLNSQFNFNGTELKRVKSKHYLKEIGAVYTLKSITSEIVHNTIKNSLTVNSNVKELKCLDFASGTGRFYFEAITILKDVYSVALKDIICKNLYAIDVDEVALSVLKCKTLSLLDVIDDDVIKALKSNIINRNALIPDTSLIPFKTNSFNFSKDFSNIFINGGFDVIFSNPPYYLLKVNGNKNTLLNSYFINLKNKVKSEIQFFKTSGVYNYSIEGMLNYYQISIEMILKMTKSNGQIGIICPSSLFADLTSSKLRKHLLNSNNLRFIRYYPEASNLFDNVAQSTVIFYLEKNSTTEDIKIEFGKNKFSVDFNTIKNVFSVNEEIPLIDKTGWKILSKISKHKKIKDLSFIRNKRGELDLTLYKDCFQKEIKTEYRLVRGNMISENGIIDKNNEFVKIDLFINKKSKEFVDNDFNKKRLICQQISNVDLSKRLKFTFSNSNDILANSCNYLNSLRGIDDLDKLQYLLNSELLNWRFKVTSSNNHINNYELNELPILDLDKLDINEFTDNKKENDILICKLYGLNNKEAEYILGYPIKTTNKKLLLNEVI
jgi:adenine-specific DNA-methyltransferase